MNKILTHLYVRLTKRTMGNVNIKRIGDKMNTLTTMELTTNEKFCILDSVRERLKLIKHNQPADRQLILKYQLLIEKFEKSVGVQELG